MELTNGVSHLAPSIDKSWSSPIFARTAAFPTTLLNNGGDDDGFVPGKGRKRTRFSRPSSDWIFVDAPPSPVKDTGNWEDEEIDAEQQEESAVESPPNVADAASPCPGQTEVEQPEVPSLSIDIHENQIPKLDFQPFPKNDGTGLATLAMNRISNLKDRYAISVQTPRLQPVPSPGMPIVSPMIGSLTPSTDYFTHPASSRTLQPNSHYLSNYELEAPEVRSISNADGSIQLDSDKTFGLESTMTQTTQTNDFEEASPSPSASPSSPAIAISSPHREYPLQNSFDISTPRESGGTFMLGGIIHLEEEDFDNEISEGIGTPENFRDAESERISDMEADNRLQSEAESRRSTRESSSSDSQITSPSEKNEHIPPREALTTNESIVNDVFTIDEDSENSDLEPESSTVRGQFLATSQSSERSISNSRRGSAEPQLQGRESVQPPSSREGSIEDNNSFNRDEFSPDVEEIDNPQFGSFEVPSSSVSPTNEAAPGSNEAIRSSGGDENVPPNPKLPVDSGLALDGAAEGVDFPFAGSISKFEQQTMHQLITPSNTQGSFESFLQQGQSITQPFANIPTPEVSQEAELQTSFASHNTVTETGVSREIDITLPTCSLPEIRAEDVELKPTITPPRHGTPDLMPTVDEAHTPETKSPTLRETSVAVTDTLETPIPTSSRQASIDRYSTADSAVGSPIENRLKPSVPGLRTTLSYYCPLSRLVEHFNRTTDIISVVTSASPISRAKGGSKHFHVTLQVTDLSLPGATTPVRILQPAKKALPTPGNGDVILLRNFQVRSFNHNMILNGVNDSAWANFAAGRFDDVQVNGAPVEYGPEEGAYITSLREWYEEEGAALVEKHQARRKEPSPRMSSVSASESGSQSSPGPKNIFKKHRRQSRRATASPRITVHELRHGRRYVDLGSPSDKESIHELRDGTVYAHP